ncbi:MAG: 3-hydroxyanthranilate 3,4-dioxygenase [Putridiphycobacter sp.]|nr:3-hydroxyanthranilate 3,4-dioxygenase [Putridiphycobacter sp.]
MILPPFNFKQWIDDNRDKLKPPVGNQVVYKDTEFIIMVVGGPNARKDFHYNEGEEFFYQIEGDITLPIVENGKIRTVEINEGDIFLLPPRVPHSPQRPANSIGLVIERMRKPDELDYCMWFCEKCNEPLHKQSFHLGDIVEQLPKILNNFYASPELVTCKSCGTVMDKPELRQ